MYTRNTYLYSEEIEILKDSNAILKHIILFYDEHWGDIGFLYTHLKKYVIVDI